MFLSQINVDLGNNPDQETPGRRWFSDIYRVHQRLWMAFPSKERKEKDPFFLDPWSVPDEENSSKPKRHEAGFLFRIERDGAPRILVQSFQRPDWEYAFQNAPYLLAGGSSERIKVIEFEPLPKINDLYRFRLFANVVRRKSEPYSDERMRNKKTRGGFLLPKKRRTEICIFPDPLPEVLPDDPVEKEKILSERWNPWREWLRDIGTNNGFIVDETKQPLFMQSIKSTIRKSVRENQEKDNNKVTSKCYNGGLFEGILICIDESRFRKALICGIGNAKAFGFGLLSVAGI